MMVMVSGLGGAGRKPPQEIIKLAWETNYYQPKQIAFKHKAIDKPPRLREPLTAQGSRRAGGTTLVPKGLGHRWV